MRGVCIFERETVNDDVGDIVHGKVGGCLAFRGKQDYFGDFIGYVDFHIVDVDIGPAFLCQFGTVVGYFF